MTKVRTTLPPVIQVRLDEPTKDVLLQYMSDHGLTISQAVRVLLALALRGEQDADTAFRSAAFREGMISGLAFTKERVIRALQTVVAEVAAPVRPPPTQQRLQPHVLNEVD